MPIIVYERSPFVLEQSQTPFLHELQNQRYVSEPLDIASYAQIRPGGAELSYIDQDSSLVLADLHTSHARRIGPFNLRNPHNNHSSLFAYSDEWLLWNTGAGL